MGKPFPFTSSAWEPPGPFGVVASMTGTLDQALPADVAQQVMLGVPLELLGQWGAVSEPFARAMAEGVKNVAEADVAFAVTGYAERGAPGEEPGLVHFAASRSGWGTTHRVEHFGDVGRGPVRHPCLRSALEMLEDALSDPVQVGMRRASL